MTAARQHPLHSQALCRGCMKSDQVVVIDALAATAEAWVGGQRVPFAPATENPQRWVMVFCGRCMKVLGRPILRTTLECGVVPNPPTSKPRLQPGNQNNRRQQ